MRIEPRSDSFRSDVQRQMLAKYELNAEQGEHKTGSIYDDVQKKRKAVVNVISSLTLLLIYVVSTEISPLDG